MELYTYRQLPSSRHTRILTLQPARSYGAPLVCTLQDTVPDEPGAKPYWALSYVWGSPIGDRPLTCEGKTILITENCEQALRHLRSYWERLRIWVDSICIDQQSIGEKNQQVVMMGHIYNLAQQVVIWLGNYDGSGRTVYWQTKLVARLHTWIPRLNSTQNLLRILYRPAESFLLNVPMEWFTRIWTVQELALASSVTIMCGRHLIPWEDIFLPSPGFWSWVRFCRLIHEEKPEHQGRISIYNKRVDDVKHLRSIKGRLVRAGSDAAFFKRDVWRIINVILVSKATNPRDNIYGLYALLERPGADLPKVDYGQSPIQVFEMFARNIIYRTDALNDLWLPSFVTHMRKTISGLPSWVPDWTYTVKESEVNSLQEPSSSVQATWRSRIHQQTLACSGQGELSLKGIQIGCVRSQSSRWPELPNPPIPTGAYQGMKEKLETLLDWLSFFEQNGHSLTGKLEALLEQLLQTRYFYDDPDVLPKQRKESKALEQWILSSYLIDRQASFTSIYDNFCLGANRLEMLHTIHRKNAGSILFATAAGHLGTTRGAIIESDGITLLAGCDWPVVVRPESGGRYRFVGLALVQGLMEGQEWPKDTRVEEMQTFTLV